MPSSGEIQSELIGQTKAAVNAPQSRRFAIIGRIQVSRSVWTAVASAPLSKVARSNALLRIINARQLTRKIDPWFAALGKINYRRKMHPSIHANDFDGLPAADSIRAGLADLAAGRESVESLLIQIGAPRLNWLGIALPAKPELDADRRLYQLLSTQHGNEAHSQFNSLIRQLVSFERALERWLRVKQRALNPMRYQTDTNRL